MPAHIEPEDWWDVDAVQRLLTNILEQPNADHSMGVQDVLRDSGGVLLDAHAHGLMRALDQLVGKKKLFTYHEHQSGRRTSHMALSLGWHHAQVVRADCAGSACVRLRR